MLSQNMAKRKIILDLETLLFIGTKNVISWHLWFHEFKVPFTWYKQTPDFYVLFRNWGRRCHRKILCISLSTLPKRVVRFS